MNRAGVVAATALLAACPSSPRAPHAIDDRALRIRIAQAEARRAGGVAELVDLAQHGDEHARELALRGLGRIGGAQAMEALTRAMVDDHRAISRAAIAAVGVAASLDELSVSFRDVFRGWGERGAEKRPNERETATVIEAIGRAGDATVQPQLLEHAVGPKIAAPVRAAIALAYGRMGRRKLALVPEVRAWLVTATAAPEREVRYAATYALSREHEPPADDQVNVALAVRVGDDDPEIRATAIAGLAKRGAIAAGRTAIEGSLRDRDWRVAVEAVRALAGEHGDDAGRDAVAAALARRWTELARGHDAEAHVIIEGLHLLAGHGERPLVAASVNAVWDAARSGLHVAPLTRGWIKCLADLVRQRAQPHPEVDTLAHCGDGNLPDHLRLPLLAELVTAGAGDVATRRAAMRILLSHDDPRVRAAALGALAAVLADEPDPHAVVATLTAAIASRDPIIAGSAVDAAPAVYDLLHERGDKLAIDTAIVARAEGEREVELSAALYDAIGKRAIPAGAAACRAGLAGPPVRARAAAACLRALGEAVGAPEIAAAQPPAVDGRDLHPAVSAAEGRRGSVDGRDLRPAVSAAEGRRGSIDVAEVIGQQVRWHVVTTRGEIVIELAPDVAPWTVATIVTLTRGGFYDGLEFHRVVPGFVVQGGDPTMSGWGGPGFTIPAEPATAMDGPGFAVGGVGIADAGRDSGGSQWFIMPAGAPHLDGRYTWAGSVVAGQPAAEALLIGDRVIKATIELRSQR